MAEAKISDLTKTLQDAAYVAVGFGVLTVRQAQAQRRQLEQQLDRSSEAVRERLSKVAAEAEDRIEPVVGAVESSLDQLEERLPEAARNVLQQVRSTAKDAGEQFRTRLSDDKATAAA